MSSTGGSSSARLGRLFLSELRLLRQPVVALALVGFLAIVGLTTIRAVLQTSDLLDGLRGRLARFAMVCDGVPDTRCPAELASAKRTEMMLADERQLVIAAQDPIGALAIPAGMIGSGPGVILLLIAAAAVVAGEFEHGTAEARFVRDPRRSRFILGKMASLAGVSVAAVVLAWLLVALIGQGVRFAGTLPDPSASAARSHALVMVSRAALAMGVVAATCLLTAVVVRNQVVTVALPSILLGALVYASNSSAVCHVSPVCWIARWMAFDRSDFGTGFIWVTVAPQGVPPIVDAGLLGGVMLAVLAVACVLARRGPSLRRG